MKSYLRELIDYSGSRAAGSLALFILVGLTQGVGLVMIIPLLQTLGITGGGESSAGGGITRFVSGAFAALGLPLNLYTLLAAYILIVSILSIVKRYQAVFNMELQQGFVLHLRSRLYAALTYAQWLFTVQRKSSDIAHGITSDIQRVGMGTHQFLQFLSSISLVVFHIAAALLLSVPLTAATLVFGGFMILLMKPLNQKAYDTGHSLRSSRKELLGSVTEHLGGMKTAKSFGAEQRHIEKFAAVNRGIKNQIARFTRLRATTRMFYEIGAVVALSIYFIAAIKIIPVPAPKLLVLVFIFTRLLPRFSTLTQNYQAIKNMLPAFSGARELYQQADAAREFPAGAERAPFEIRDGISFRGVSFRYSSRSETGQSESGQSQTDALREVTIAIPARRITAVVGASGAGKSTLADVLLGLLKPSGGKIIVDGREIVGDHIHAWRHSIGYVPQETFLFNDTLRTNLLWANPSAGEDQLWEAVRMASAEDFVKQLPEGLDTVTGDRGIRLSGGERQRIALARALLRKPRLLVLDEATSALDSENEIRIHQAIDSLQGQLTIVIIAHRLSTIRSADQIIVLDQGRVIQQGTWESLSKDPEGKFYQMVGAAHTPG